MPSSSATCVLCRSVFTPAEGYPIDLAYPRALSGQDLGELDPRVVTCPTCQHQFISPLPSPEFFEAFYASYMNKASSGFYRDRAKPTISSEFRARYARWLARLLELAVPDQVPPTLLDIGAGLGMFLRLAGEHGFSPKGLERNVPACDALKRDYQIPTINSSLEEYAGDERFDVVTMWDLLEHLPDPRAGLARARSLLRPGGVFALEIPVRDSLLHWTAKGLFRATAGNVRRPVHLICGVHHLHYFSRSGIFRLMRESGLDPIEDYRDETSLKALHRRPDETVSDRLKTTAYNLALDGAFGAARVLRRQNKLIVFARAT